LLEKLLRAKVISKIEEVVTRREGETPVSEKSIFKPALALPRQTQREKQRNREEEEE
jgi:hypothetical protein